MRRASRSTCWCSTRSGSQGRSAGHPVFDNLGRHDDSTRWAVGGPEAATIAARKEADQNQRRGYDRQRQRMDRRKRLRHGKRDASLQTELPAARKPFSVSDVALRLIVTWTGRTSAASRPCSRLAPVAAARVERRSQIRCGVSCVVRVTRSARIVVMDDDRRRRPDRRRSRRRPTARRARARTAVR